MAQGSAILYQNIAKTLTLLDIPSSIAFAQGTSGRPCSKSVYSSLAIEEPWRSTEPKSAKAKANVAAHGMTSESNAREQHLMQNALEELRAAWKGDWCLDRKVSPDLQEPNIHAPSTWYGRFAERQRSQPLILRAIPDFPLRPCDLHLWPIQNSSPDLLTVPVEVVFNHNATHPLLHTTSTTYSMPPASTFIISDIADTENLFASRGFRMGTLTLLPDHSTTTSAGAGQFDFVLLDPPWPNRSARRSRNYWKSHDPLQDLKRDLEDHIAPGGFVACWITNSPTTRAQAMELFEAWDVDLAEEWYWLKVTKDGRPVTQLGGVWRKPYETLLIGRKQTRHAHGSPSRKKTFKTRIIVAVPDVHSRKPCIKELIEEAFGFKEGEYRALEVFARHLTAGWWAWGDECLKFQWDGWWCDDDGVDGGEERAG